KVGKEEIAGLIAALELYQRRDHQADQARWRGQMQHILEAVAGLTDGGQRSRPRKTGERQGIHASLVEPGDSGRGYPICRIELGERQRAIQVALDLEAGEPRVCVGLGALDQGALTISPLALQPGQEITVAQRLVAVLGTEQEVELD
ncbi:MAG: hypothetical protein ACYDAG_13540, partial [Chloroflexota bacterium]